MSYEGRLSTSPYRDRENNIYCGNCGTLGHTYKKCRNPIISCGVILFSINKKYNNIDDKYRFLLIRRKDTLGYIEFLRGKYDEMDKDYIKKLLNMMTLCEIDILMKNEFADLWNRLWLNRNKKQYQTEYNISFNKFTNLKKGKYFELENLIKDANIVYTEKEWGFPKGRRNLKETDYNCALREFEEEIGINRDEYDVLRNIKPIEETFIGSNNVKYKHIYYIAKSKTNKDFFIDPMNKQQITEIGKIEWLTINTAKEKIRPYNIEKKGVLDKVLKLLISNNY